MCYVRDWEIVVNTIVIYHVWQEDNIFNRMVVMDQVNTTEVKRKETHRASQRRHIFPFTPIHTAVAEANLHHPSAQPVAVTIHTAWVQSQAQGYGGRVDKWTVVLPQKGNRNDTDGYFLYLKLKASGLPSTHLMAAGAGFDSSRGCYLNISPSLSPPISGTAQQRQQLPPQKKGSSCSKQTHYKKQLSHFRT